MLKCLDSELLRISILEEDSKLWENKTSTFIYKTKCHIILHSSKSSLLGIIV